jgi:hypothetical protein
MAMGTAAVIEKARAVVGDQLVAQILFEDLALMTLKP